jgi:crotonobetainyl-CoA:carnitine CoA-transferase CaiB-like acyl-CoA transferase
MSVTGNHESGPTVVGCAPIDQHGAALLALGIAAAFVRKLTVGEGTRIEGSLFNAALDLQAEALAKYMTRRPGREILRRDKHVGSWYHNAPYGVYRLRDAHIVLSMNDPARIADSLRSEALRAMQTFDLYEHRDEFARAVACEMASCTFAEIEHAFAQTGIWYERVQDYDDLAADPQALHNAVFQKVVIGRKHATIVAHPLRYDGATPALRRIPIAVGQDTSIVLAEIGYTPEQVSALIDEGVVIAPSTRLREADPV